jgi:hypothetical protein
MLCAGREESCRLHSRCYLDPALEAPSRASLLQCPAMPALYQWKRLQNKRIGTSHINQFETGSARVSSRFPAVPPCDSLAFCTDRTCYLLNITPMTSGRLPHGTWLLLCPACFIVTSELRLLGMVMNCPYGLRTSAALSL